MIVAIIPALNEEATISTVVRELYEQGIDRVIVVDNGSTDETISRATHSGAHSVTELQKGYGKACLCGIANLPPETRWVLFCDADGSDDLSQLPSFFAHLEEHDFLIGNRRATPQGRQNLTHVQNFGNWLSGFLMKLGWRKGFSDLGPLRFVKKEALELLNMQDETFGWTVEMQAKVLEHNLSYREIPVNYRPRQGGVSKISGNISASIQAGSIILSTLAKIWLQSKHAQRAFVRVAFFSLLIGAVVMAFFGDPASPYKAPFFFLGAFFMFIGYSASCLRKQVHFANLFWLAILLRCILLPMPPGDDIWRYIWEGYIQTQGYNPYNTPPNSPLLSALRPDWWQNINHKDVTAIYPPLTQLLFRCVASFSHSVIVFKLLFLFADLFIGFLVARYWGIKKASLYLLNPLVIYCFAGGGHYEPLFLLPLMGSVILWERKSKSLSTFFFCGLLLGASASVKLIAIFALGFMGWNLLLKLFTQSQRAQTFRSLIILFASFILIPLVSSLVFIHFSGVPNQWIPTSFVEKARSASLIPWLMEFTNQDPYFPFSNQVFMFPLCGVLALVILFLRTSLLHCLASCFFTLLAFSPLIHGWYFTWLFPVGLKYHQRIILPLSFTAFFYFLLPYRLCKTGVWELQAWERIAIWSPYLILIYMAIKTRLKTKLLLPVVSSSSLQK